MPEKMTFGVQPIDFIHAYTELALESNQQLERVDASTLRPRGGRHLFRFELQGNLHLSLEDPESRICLGTEEVNPTDPNFEDQIDRVMDGYIVVTRGLGSSEGLWE